MSVGLDLVDRSTEHSARIADDADLLLTLGLKLSVPARVRRGRRLQQGLLLASLGLSAGATGNRTRFQVCLRRGVEK